MQILKCLASAKQNTKFGFTTIILLIKKVSMLKTCAYRKVKPEWQRVRTPGYQAQSLIKLT